MTIEAWLRRAKKRTASLDAELILLAMLQKITPRRIDRSYLYAYPSLSISRDVWVILEKMLERRESGEPLAYVIGEKEFYGRKFAVRSGVLIPRPETENLIELVKELPLPKQPHFLEIGTGSGCIAITLALEYPQSYVLATDLSVKALDIASGNDMQHEGRVEFVESNLLRDVEFNHAVGEPEHFDVLVANLPYVDRDWEWLDRPSLSFEPTRALYAGEGGLALYRRLFREIVEYRRAGEVRLDYVVLEADPCQHEKLIRIAQKYGFKNLKIDGYGLIFAESNG